MWCWPPTPWSVLENTILGKPGTLAQARQMLEMLSGRTHKVCTAWCS